MESAPILPLIHGLDIHERTLTVNDDFITIKRSYYELRPSIFPITVKRSQPSKLDPHTGQFQNINCVKSIEFKGLYVFRVLTDPWEVKAVLNYNPLNYNLYGSCLSQISTQTGASVETLKKISEEHLFSQ